MSDHSHFERISFPRKRPLRKLGQEELTTLIGGGIVNPLGPTLTALVLDGPYEEGRRAPVLHVMLNPFVQQLTEVGLARVGSTWNPYEAIQPFLGNTFAACPTLLLPSAMLEPAQAAGLYAYVLGTFREGSRVYESVRRYPGDPWTRIQAAMDELSAGPEDAEAREEGRPLTEEEALELARTLLRPEHLAAELQAFMASWSGAIEFQGKAGLGRKAMSLERFIGYFAALAVSCNLPKLQSA